MTRFVDLAETFHLPVVHFVDNPGFVIGTDAEKAATIRYGARALAAIYQATTPWCSVIVRKVYGVAGAAHQDASKLSYRYAWPSGNWGSLPLEGGIEAAYKAQLEAAEDPAALRAEIEQRLTARQSPFKTAEAFLVEEIIDPRDTRPLLCEFAELAGRVLRNGTDRPRPASLITTGAAVDFAPCRPPFGRTPSTGRARSRSTPRTPASTCSRRAASCSCAICRSRFPAHEYLDLEYMDWKSGGDTNFAPIATADGELDCRGFWSAGDERPDKGARFTSNASKCPTIKEYVESVGRRLRTGAHDQARAPGPRLRVPQLPPRRQQPLQSRRPTVGSCARWLELTDNPDSYMLLMDTGPDGLPDPDDRGARAAAPGRALPRRHAAALARGRAQRHRATLRVDHELRERARARGLGRVPAVAPRDSHLTSPRAVAGSHEDDAPGPGWVQSRRQIAAAS